jgi:hypothetical protein
VSRAIKTQRQHDRHRHRHHHHHHMCTKRVPSSISECRQRHQPGLSWGWQRRRRGWVAGSRWSCPSWR